MADISKRKADHLDLAASGDVGFKRTTTLFECIRLIHDALPELDFDSLDASVTILGKTLRAPILIAGMTGGTERAQRINRELASIAEERGYGFGLGSQRAMQKHREYAATYRVRDVAPTVLLLGNVGAVQARGTSSTDLADLAHSVGADALCIHLNPAMELVQTEGDRDFRGCLDTLRRLVAELGIPIVAKETGCGISRDVAERLSTVGVRHVDVSGAGGTSWVAVETQRADETRRRLGETFWEWGIPTAASVSFAAGVGFESIIATGGIASGLDIAKAIALGAHAGGIARPVLQAFEQGGRAAALALLQSIENEIKMAMLLCGAPSIDSLRNVPRVVLGELARWVEQTNT
jgi:isopentenyl-diphosphate delta-isomerase